MDRKTASRKRVRRSLGSTLRWGVLVVSAAITISAAQAAENEAADRVQERLRIDRIMGALDDPTLRRAQARVASDWRGPRGLPPITERRTCPGIGANRVVLPFVPAFC